MYTCLSKPINIDILDWWECDNFFSVIWIHVNMRWLSAAVSMAPLTNIIYIYISNRWKPSFLYVCNSYLHVAFMHIKRHCRVRYYAYIIGIYLCVCLWNIHFIAFIISEIFLKKNCQHKSWFKDVSRPLYKSTWIIFMIWIQIFKSCIYLYILYLHWQCQQ